MPQRLLMDAGAQSTCASAINSTQTTVTLQSAAGFSAPAIGQQFSVVILDSGNPAWNPATPLATPYEYQQVNSVSGNVLTFGPGGGGASRAAYAGTTPKSFFAGATIAQATLAEDFIASAPWKFDEQAPSSGTSITIPSSGSIPASYLGVNWRTLRIRWYARSAAASNADTITIRFNGDTGNNYDYQFIQALGATTGSGSTIGTGNPIVGNIPAANSFAGVFASGWIEIPNFAASTTRRSWTGMQMRNDAGNFGMDLWSGDWTNTANPITSVSLILATGPFASGCLFLTELSP